MPPKPSILYKGIADAVATYGMEVVRSRRLAGYLSDFRSWESPAVRNILLALIDSGLTDRLFFEALDPQADHAPAIAAVESGLAAEGYDPAHCRYVVRCMAAALGLVSGEIMMPEFVSDDNSDSLVIIPFAGLDICMVRVKGGTFSLGATFEQGIEASYDERPAVSVTVSDFLICDRPVTQALWEAVTGTNPSRDKGRDLPVSLVSWYECEDFCRCLAKATGRPFRLPSEAQWEYAARGGSLSRAGKYAGAGAADADSHIWHKGNSGGVPHAVASRLPNELGLYDLSGNIAEWCADWYFNSYAQAANSTDPQGPPDGRCKVTRGGSCDSPLIDCRTARRGMLNPDYRSRLVGMRLCL